MSVLDRSYVARRDFLRQLGAGLAFSGAAWSAAPAVGRAALADPPRPKVAAILTQFFHRSHAHVIVENFLGPYLFNGQRTEPGMDLVAFYVDQLADGDMAQQVAKQYGIPIYPTIAKALCRGGDKLAVDAVLSIGEHGNYPVSPKGQVEYPRKRFFDEIATVFESSGRVAPVFNDKHLSFRWDWAKEMYDTARRLNIPFMAGSSVPLAQRRPPFELPLDCEFASALALHGGPVESYDFHGVELLQSQVEARRGGEAGVASVQFLEGEALWKAADDGLWDPALATAALDAELGRNPAPLRQRVEELCRRESDPKGRPVQPHALRLTYRDGWSATVFKAGERSTRWNFACKLKGDKAPRATAYYVGPWDNRNLFKALSHAIQTFFRTGEAPYPVERTLLATGILDASLDSRAQGGQSVETPHLDVAYQAKDYRELREMGASWKILTASTPQPEGIHRFGNP